MDEIVESYGDFKKDTVINEVSKANLIKQLKAAKNLARTDKEMEFLELVEKNIGKWQWLMGIYVTMGNIHLAANNRLTASDLEDILPLMKKYKMNLDNKNTYALHGLENYNHLRLYYN